MAAVEALHIIAKSLRGFGAFPYRRPVPHRSPQDGRLLLRKNLVPEYLGGDVPPLCNFLEFAPHDGGNIGGGPRDREREFRRRKLPNSSQLRYAQVRAKILMGDTCCLSVLGQVGNFPQWNLTPGAHASGVIFLEKPLHAGLLTA
jgi:hypothetical protein